MFRRAPNAYPVAQNAEPFQNEAAMQFADGQRASAFAQEGDTIAWGQHQLADIQGGAEAIIRTDQGPFYLKDGVITDIEGSESRGSRFSEDFRDPTKRLPDIQIGSPWQMRWGAPLTVTGVLFRDGLPGSPPDPSRRQNAQPNPFDAAANRLAAVDQKTQRTAARKLAAAQRLAQQVLPQPPAPELYRPVGRVWQGDRTGR